MKADRIEKTICLLFFGALALMSAAFILGVGARSYSPLEKRYLASAPRLTAEEVFSGRFADEAESYMADHMPGRDALVGAAAYYDLFSGRQNTKDIVRGESGRLYERPVEWNAKTAEENAAAMDAFAGKIGKNVDLMLVPSAGYIMRDDLGSLHESYEDADIIARCFALTGDKVVCTDLSALFDACPEKADMYYATDHHWTSLGAWTAAEAYLGAKDRPLAERGEYEIKKAGDFRGSTYSRSALWLSGADTLQLWDCGGDFTVSDSESGTPHEGLFYTERLKEEDKYTVFLDGNHALVRVENNAADARGKLLVIRDSFSNCLGCFLAEGYKTVVLADLRYYKLPLSELCAQEDFDDVLVVYGVGNYLEGSNLNWLE